MKIVIKYYWVFLIFLFLFISFATRWTLTTYEGSSFEQILFHITEPISGVESTVIYDFFKETLLTTLIYTFIFTIAIILIKTSFDNKKLDKIIKYFVNILSIFTIVICLYLLGFFQFMINGNKESKFIENNFVNPLSVEI